MAEKGRRKNNNSNNNNRLAREAFPPVNRNDDEIAHPSILKQTAAPRKLAGNVAFSEKMSLQLMTPLANWNLSKPRREDPKKEPLAGRMYQGVNLTPESEGVFINGERPNHFNARTIFVEPAYLDGAVLEKAAAKAYPPKFPRDPNTGQDLVTFKLKGKSLLKLEPAAVQYTNDVIKACIKSIRFYKKPGKEDAKKSTTLLFYVDEDLVLQELGLEKPADINVLGDFGDDEVTRDVIGMDKEENGATLPLINQLNLNPPVEEQEAAKLLVEDAHGLIPVAPISRHDYINNRRRRKTVLPVPITERPQPVMNEDSDQIGILEDRRDTEGERTVHAGEDPEQLDADQPEVEEEGQELQDGTVHGPDEQAPLFTEKELGHIRRGLRYFGRPGGILDRINRMIAANGQPPLPPQQQANS